MKHFAIKASVIALALSMSASGAQAFQINPESRVGKVLSNARPAHEFRGDRPWTTDELPAGSRMRAAAPVNQFKGLPMYDFLEAPDGSVWFYTADYEYTTVEFEGGYKESQISGYTFTVYDQVFKEVGKISDKIRLKENETRAVSVTLDPVVSDSYFNDDSNFELIVYLGVNTTAYVNNYYNKVYSIGGETDDEGYDKCIYEFDGRIVDVVTVGEDADKQYYFTVVTDFVPNADDYGSDQYIDYINAYAYHLVTYKAPGEAVLEYDVNLSNIPGDTTDGIYFISKVEGGVPYFILSHYALPYFVDPSGFAQDESATEGNSLIIDVFNGVSGEKVSTTQIPVIIDKVDGKLTYCFYSIGSLAWRDDVIMSAPYGSPSAPAFIVAKDFCLASTLEDVETTFSIHKTDGSEAKVLSSKSDGLAMLSDIDGFEPQAMFVETLEDGSYLFRFVDIQSGVERIVINQANGGDPLSAVCERAPFGNSYKYAFEMTYYTSDDAGNEYSRVAWFNSDGTFDRIDKINVGKDVMASAVNMTRDCLNPDLFDNTNTTMEYAVLVKRTVGATTRNEFMVVGDDGKWLAHFSEDDGKGLPYSFTLAYGEDANYLQMVYNDNYTYNIDIYKLPLIDAAGLTEVVLPGEAAISFDGQCVMADGEIDIFTPAGAKVASGAGRVDVSSLAKGVYIVKSTAPDGKCSALKINL